VLEVNEKLKRISLSMKSGERPAGGGRRGGGKDGGGKDGRGNGGNGGGRREPERQFTMDDLLAKFNKK
jgi:hypothetical protein